MKIVRDTIETRVILFQQEFCFNWSFFMYIIKNINRNLYFFPCKYKYIFLGPKINIGIPINVTLMQYCCSECLTSALKKCVFSDPDSD